MKGPFRQARLRLPRLGRLLLGRNKLRRPCDRIEGAIIAVLLAAFLTASVGAACIAGHLYRSERAAAARLRPATGFARPDQTGGFTGASSTAGRRRPRPNPTQPRDAGREPRGTERNRGAAPRRRRR